MDTSIKENKMKKEPIKGFEAIPPRIKTAREQLRLSQREMAKQMGISASYFSEIEAGKKPPGGEFFYKLIHLLNINPIYLFLGIGKMFMPQGMKDIEDGFDFDGDLEDMDSLFWLMKRSKFLENTILGYAGKIIIENEKVIKLGLEKHKKED